jgi:hypothetical protein
MRYCRMTSRAKAATPSATAAVLDNRVVASVEPSATVTTKGLSLASDRFPLTRSISTRAA